MFQNEITKWDPPATTATNGQTVTSPDEPCPRVHVSGGTFTPTRHSKTFTQSMRKSWPNIIWFHWRRKISEYDSACKFSRTNNMGPLREICLSEMIRLFDRELRFWMAPLIRKKKVNSNYTRSAHCQNMTARSINNIAHAFSIRLRSAYMRSSIFFSYQTESDDSKNRMSSA